MVSELSYPFWFAGKLIFRVQIPDRQSSCTDLNNLIVRQGKTKNAYQKFYGDKKKCFPYPDNLKTFGEEVIVADRAKIKAKLRDHGKKCLWLGYAKNQSTDTYRLLI